MHKLTISSTIHPMLYIQIVKGMLRACENTLFHSLEARIRNHIKLISKSNFCKSNFNPIDQLTLLHSLKIQNVHTYIYTCAYTFVYCVTVHDCVFMQVLYHT